MRLKSLTLIVAAMMAVGNTCTLTSCKQESTPAATEAEPAAQAEE